LRLQIYNAFSVLQLFLKKNIDFFLLN